MPKPTGRQSRSPIEQARSWWAERHARGAYVVSTADAPSAHVARVLRQERMVLDVAGKRVWILTRPDRTDQRAILLQNYWPVVAVLLRRYEPAAIVGIDAVRLYLGQFAPPAALRVHHASSHSKLGITLEGEFRVHLRPGAVSADRTTKIDGPGDSTLPVLAPAALLGTLDESEIAADIEAVSAWLRHLVIRKPDLDAALETDPRPVVIQRLADLAHAVGNPRLGEQLDAAARRYTGRTVTPAETGVGTRLVVPAVLRTVPRGTGIPWTDEQRMRLERQTEDVRTVIGDALDTLTTFPTRTLIANAQQAKAYDAYHSTTMEGYRITPEAAAAIVRGEPLPNGPHTPQELEAAMAVQGYSIAFDSIIGLVRAPTKERAPVTGALILDLYEDLFRPSVDAGIIEPGALRGWRTGNVSLRGWRHVPPNAKKIRDLIAGLEAFAARDDIDPVTRAIVVHLEFVTIHPFLDGNGRLGRLLMNLCLLSRGLPWVTVRSDERMAFFRTIEQAQVDQETKPFARFLRHLVAQAITDLRAVRDRRGRGRERGTGRNRTDE